MKTKFDIYMEAVSESLIRRETIEEGILQTAKEKIASVLPGETGIINSAKAEARNELKQKSFKELLEIRKNPANNDIFKISSKYKQQVDDLENRKESKEDPEKNSLAYKIIFAKYSILNEMIIEQLKKGLSKSKPINRFNDPKGYNAIKIGETGDKMGLDEVEKEIENLMETKKVFSFKDYPSFKWDVRHDSNKISEVLTNWKKKDPSYKLSAGELTGAADLTKSIKKLKTT
jgi:hypothetical protein